jgi:uncharacterized RDD family membrane protein YckC
MSSTPSPQVGWQVPPEEPGPAPGIEFAPHGARLVAYILDGILSGCIIGALLILGMVTLFAGTTVQDNTITSVNTGAAVGFVLFGIAAFIVGSLYFPFFWARGGQTPGMMPFGLRVVRDRDGGRIGWGTALLRLVGMWIAFGIMYIGIIWILVDRRRRGWQDLIAGTVVVRQP